MIPLEHYRPASAATQHPRRKVGTSARPHQLTDSNIVETIVADPAQYACLAVEDLFPSPVEPLGDFGHIVIRAVGVGALGKTVLIDSHGMIDALYLPNWAVSQVQVLTTFTPGPLCVTLDQMARAAGTVTFPQIFETSDPFQDLSRQLDTLDGQWNDHRGAPNRNAIGNARKVLEAARTARIVPDRIVPAEASIFVYFWRANRYADIECENDGSILGVLSDRSGTPEVWVTKATRLDTDLARIRAFLF